MAFIITTAGETKEIDRPFIVHPSSIAGVAIVASEVEFDISMLTDAAEHLFPVIAGLLALVTKTADYTALNSDEVIICDANSGGFTITLPPVSGITGKRYYIKKIDSTANVVTIDGDAAETIDDGATATLTSQYEAVTIVSDASEWFII